MQNDIESYKPRLLEYLQKKGLDIDTSKSFPIMRCISPDHHDADPSMSIYDEQVNCNSCGFKGDIFDCAGALSNAQTFPDKIKEIQTILGEQAVIQQPVIKKDKKPATAAKYVALGVEEARKIYTDKRILEMSDFVLNGKAKDGEKRKLSIPSKHGFFPYRNEAGLIELMSVRIEDEQGEKDVLSFYYDGKAVRMRAYPVLIYNRDKLAGNPGKPFIMHEGEKCCDIAEVALPEFVHITWNGGGKKWKNIQGLELLKGRTGCLLPDDDQKTAPKTNHLLQHEQQPGQATMIGLKNKLRLEHDVRVKILPVFEDAREIKPDGADIEEILQAYDIDHIKYIISNAGKDDGADTRGELPGGNVHGTVGGTAPEKQRIKKTNDIQHNHTNDNLCDTDHGYPFKILGIADDGNAYFLCYQHRLHSYKLTSLSDKILMDLGGLNFWISEVGIGGVPKKDDWMKEIDKIMQLSKSIDFDVESVRGRGAWRSKNGDICYHDGSVTVGNPDQSWTFMRRRKLDIGIRSAEAPPEVRSEIMGITKGFSFRTEADAVRLLAWSAIAAFGGALKWRTAILATGPSGCGKSTVLDNVLRPISFTLAASGTQSTEPGVRQYVSIDSLPVSIDEFDAKKLKDKERLEDILALMRGSTTDDSPMVMKGSSGGIASTFKMKSMFCFAAVNASVDNVANDNRIMRVDFVKRNVDPNFVNNLLRIKELLSDENCRGIRSFTWNHLPKIIALSNRLEFVIQSVTKQDSRFACGDSILLATDLIVWQNKTHELEDDFLKEYCTDFYRNQTVEEKRDETEEMIERILDEAIIINSLNRERKSFREILILLKKYLDWDADDKPHQGSDGVLKYNDFLEYKRIIEQQGLSVHRKTRELAIVNNHHVIMRILDMGKGYHRQIERHADVILRGVAIGIDGTTKRGTVISGFLDYDIDEEAW